MPDFKTKRKFRNRRRNGKKKGPSVKTVNRKVKEIQKMIELKYNDVLFNNDVGPDGADLQLLNGLANGSAGLTQRIGNEVTCTSLQFRGQWVGNVFQTDPVLCRMIVFWDRQANQAPPTIPGPTNNGLLATQTITDLTLAPFAYEQNDRYRVLYDKLFLLNPRVVRDFDPATGEVTELVPPSVMFKKKIKLGRRVKYDSTGSGIADISTNSLYAVFISDAIQFEPTLYCGFRLYYKDA